MEAPGGEPGYPHSGWVGRLFSDELGAYKLDEQLAAEVLLLGRTTYESFYGAWPHGEGPMAEKINTMRKVVVSTTLSSSDWQDTTVVSDLNNAAGELKQDVIVPRAARPDRARARRLAPARQRGRAADLPPGRVTAARLAQRSRCSTTASAAAAVEVSRTVASR